MAKPIVIGVTLGDINGIGPEIALAAARKRPAGTRLVLVGHDPLVQTLAAEQGLPPVPAWQPLQDRLPRHGLSVWDPAPGAALKRRPGRVDTAASLAAAKWIEAAANVCLAGSLQAMVTAPICKEGFKKAGIDFPGHTEYLAALTKARRFAMLLVGEPLRVVLVTRHVPLRAVAQCLTGKGVYEAIRIATEALPWMGAGSGCIGVCGLNPHAGDGGALGDEELRVIRPAIRRAQKAGIQVAGPVPADVIFHQALSGTYAAVIAMYHDQGLGPLKMHAFESGVNITLGLPFVRTSPDHGTAFDIAGTGRANPSSMCEAIRMAGELAVRQNPWSQS